MNACNIFIVCIKLEKCIFFRIKIYNFLTIIYYIIKHGKVAFFNDFFVLINCNYQSMLLIELRQLYNVYNKGFKDSSNKNVSKILMI